LCAYYYSTKDFFITISLLVETTDPSEERFQYKLNKNNSTIQQYTTSNFIIVHHKKESKEAHSTKNPRDSTPQTPSSQKKSHSQTALNPYNTPSLKRTLIITTLTPTPLIIIAIDIITTSQTLLPTLLLYSSQMQI